MFFLSGRLRQVLLYKFYYLLANAFVNNFYPDFRPDKMSMSFHKTKSRVILVAKAIVRLL